MKRMFGSVARRAAIAAALCTIHAGAMAGPPPVVGGPLLAEIAAMPPGEWRVVNRNLFSDVWTPASLRPLKGKGNPEPDKIIAAWSGFAWDSRRGDLILYGGGHANYNGNDVYRWRSSSMMWERSSLPSEVTTVPGSIGLMAIDGADAAPGSAHTYDNNIYLPLLDRFLTFGGALSGTGGYYVRPDESNPGSARRTGPYFFDPERADPGRVGGTTGSHVQRVAPYPNIVGGNMWSNRDHTRTIPQFTQPAKHTSGCTAYAEENGVDVVYVGAAGGSGSNPNLYRYTFPSVSNPALDTIARVGVFWNGTGGQTTCGYDPVRKLFVRTGSNINPFVYWDLTTAGTGNRDARVEVNASIAAFRDWINLNGKQVDDCGLDFDPLDDSFAVWCGGPQVWKLRPPAVIGVSGWTIDPQPINGPAPGLGTGTGVLGKWKYVPGYDVFMALHSSTAGNIWIYKPLDWSPPTLGDPVNWAPQATLLGPAAGTVYTLGDSITIRAAASDVDGTIARVEYLANGAQIGTLTTPPYDYAWTPLAGGSYTLQARAVDNRGGTAYSTTAAVQVVIANAPPSVSLVSPVHGATFAAGAAVPLMATATDSDGSIARVEFFVDGSKVGEDTSAPYTMNWTPPGAGSYSLTAKATDNDNLGTLSSAIRITVSTAPPAGTTVVLQQGILDYTGSIDTMLSSYHPSTNFGGRTTLQAIGDRYMNLFRFAIFESEGGPVPDGATIESATLQIYKQSYAGVFRLNALLKPWEEGQANWQVSRAGVPWAAPGASGVNLDFEAQYDAEFSAPYDPGWMVFDVRDRLRAIANGTPNHGWRLALVSSGSNTRNLRSTEYEDLMTRPKLVVTYSQGDTPNQPPTVALTAPADGIAIELGASISIGANASDVDGSVAKVEFLANGAKIGEDATSPYSLVWTPTATGPYTLVARAIDNRGLAASSAARTLNVTPGNVPPTVAIASPAPGASFVYGTTIEIEADASDADGNVTRVEFFANGSKLGEDTNPPYAITWTPGAVGDYTLTARVTDNGNATTTSAAVAMKVTAVSGSGATIVLQQGMSGYVASSDTMLSSYHPNNNFGNRTTLQEFGARYTNLFHFAVFASEGGPVPDGATIESATLEIYKQSYSGTYRLHAMLKPWSEGQATWNVSRTGVPWGVAGANGVDDDYAAIHDAVFAAAYEPGWMTFDVTERFRAIANGTGNYGWRLVLLSSGSTTRNLLSSEYPDNPALRPRLTITYTSAD